MVVALFFWAFIQSFLFGVTVLIYRNSRPNRILATFFFLVSLVILFQYLLKYELWLLNYPFTLIFPDIINLSMGPVLFLYSRQLVFRKWENQNFIHFIPSLLLSLYFVFFEIMPEDKFTFFNYINTNAHVAVLSAILISNISYLTLFYKNYKKCEEIPVKESEKVKKWMEILMLFFTIQLFINLVIWIMHFSLNQMNIMVIANVNTLKNLIFIGLNAITVFATSFFVITNPEVITSLGTKISEHIKTKSFSISNNEAELHIERLEQIMENEKIYLDSQLNEKLLAEKLNIQPYYLSKLINEHLKCSFKEYINKARIEETKRLLESEQANELTLFAIAIDSGFSSESVFYTNFKKFTGMTPNQYKKKVREIK